jgi:ubiquinone biosynthesis UbiH/UbiF/VisC/COQ6 family hydroxylase
MQDHSCDVAVVGTGVVGLAAALGCAQLGLRTTLIGPAPRTGAAGTAAFDARVYALAPSSVALLERLRVWQAIDPARVEPIARMQVFGDDGAELRFDAYGAAVERLATIVEESALLRALEAGAGFTANLGRITQPFDRLQIDTSRARLTLADGAVVEARLVIAADGANSAVRAAAGLHADTVSYGQTAIVANLAASRPHDRVAYQWFTDEGVVALLPLPGQMVSLVWSAPEAVASELLALTDDAFAVRVTMRCASCLGTLAVRDARQSFALRRLAVDRMVAARLALVGDAAHVVHPLAGQGLNLGLQDVSEILGVLGAREDFRDLGDATLLRRYARARAEPVALMRLATDGLSRLFSHRGAGVRGVRNAGMALVNRVPPLKNALIRHALGG